MKAVFGVALLLVGFTIGYLVLAGKIPAQSTATGSGPSSTSGGWQPQASATAMGLPTMQHLHDVNASLGGMG